MEKLHSFISFVAGGRVGGFLMMFLAMSFTAGVLHAVFRAWKIQPNGFRWKQFRNEFFFAGINVVLSGIFLGALNGVLNKYNLIQFNHAPAGWWVTVLEYALFFVLFDTWFYWFHRLMH